MRRWSSRTLCLQADNETVSGTVLKDTSPLISAATWGERAVRALVEHGADVNFTFQVTG